MRDESTPVARGEPAPEVKHPAHAVQRGVERLAESSLLDRLAGKLQHLVGRAWRVRGGRRAKDFLNGTWLEHPLHPALTDIATGAWTTATVFDLISLTGRRRLDGAASAALSVGVAGAVGAALTGLADWSDTRGQPRSLGMAHASLNTAALALQVVSIQRRRRGLRGGPALSLVGLATAATAAYIGGDLVYRLGTQVDRHLGWEGGPHDFRPALDSGALKDETPTQVEVEGARVMLVRHQGDVFALDDVCSHAGCSLSNGQVEAGAVTCACHGSTYRLRDGAVIHGPSPYTQPTYDVHVTEGRIYLRRRSL